VIQHLIIGGRGLIGSALVQELGERKDAWPFLATSRRASDEDDGWLLHRLGLDDPHKLPDTKVVYLVAAMPGFAVCEGSVESWLVNVDAQIELARRYRNSAFVVYVSSDAVEWCGGTAYARQKAQVEGFIHAIDGAVVRPTRVPQDKARTLAALLVEVGNGRKQGTHRWKP